MSGEEFIIFEYGRGKSMNKQGNIITRRELLKLYIWRVLILAFSGAGGSYILYSAFNLNYPIKRLTVVCIGYLIILYYFSTTMLDIIFNAVSYITSEQVSLVPKDGYRFRGKYILTYVDEGGEKKKKFEPLDFRRPIPSKSFNKEEVKIYYTRWSRILLGYEQDGKYHSFR